MAKKKIKPQQESKPVAFTPDDHYEREREKKLLLAKYKNKEEVLYQLREIPVHPRTYEFLGELFFNAAAAELDNDPPPDEWIKQLKELRNDVYLLFELAKAARVV